MDPFEVAFAGCETSEEYLARCEELIGPSEITEWSSGGSVTFNWPDEIEINQITQSMRELAVAIQTTTTIWNEGLVVYMTDPAS